MKHDDTYKDSVCLFKACGQAVLGGETDPTYL